MYFHRQSLTILIESAIFKSVVFSLCAHIIVLLLWRHPTASSWCRTILLDNDAVISKSNYLPYKCIPISDSGIKFYMKSIVFLKRRGWKNYSLRNLVCFEEIFVYQTYRMSIQNISTYIWPISSCKWGCRRICTDTSI